ncbi:MAG: glycosyltransferase [Candidatus Cloacimonetes bacterium]|nr:glycosyltransferase [Candidatus Cloacimonadota bacterium]
MKILYISYFFPPLGGPAALRNVKTVSYLSEMGTKISVLTVQDIVYAYSDPGLLDLCKGVEIHRVASLDPMALLRRILGKKSSASQAVYKRSPERLKLFVRRLAPIDDKIGWLPQLLKSGRKLLSSEDFDLVYVSCGPFSSALAAYKLADEFDKPLVVDYRDYWTLLSDYDLMGSLLKRAYSRAWEERIIKRASLLICATKGIRDDLAKAFDPSLHERSFLLYNGHDERDFLDIPPASPSRDFFTLSYFGNIYARRSLKSLYQGILELEREELIPTNLRILLYGNFNREVYDEIAQSGIGERVKVMPQLSHVQALTKMQEADALILVINSSSPRGTLTSKVFEYLRSGRPILAMVPRLGEAAALLSECGISTMCPMESVSAIKDCLSTLFDTRFLAPGVSPRLHKYERGKQLAALHEQLGSLIESTK